jgi:NAD(P)-dependent dehydrogenase (short-subunit alcohol dehydrogenase family)
MGLEIFLLEGKSAIITGGSKGLGESMALALAETSAEVLITSRHWDEVSETAEHIQTATGKRVLPLQSDVTNAIDVEAMKHKALDEFGKIDILINNAGINIRKPLLALSDEDWHQVMNINPTDPMLCARSVGRHMVGRKSGRIINLASMLGTVGLAEHTPSKRLRNHCVWNSLKPRSVRPALKLGWWRLSCIESGKYTLKKAWTGSLKTRN